MLVQTNDGKETSDELNQEEREKTDGRPCLKKTPEQKSKNVSCKMKFSPLASSALPFRLHQSYQVGSLWQTWPTLTSSGNRKKVALGVNESAIMTFFSAKPSQLRVAISYVHPRKMIFRKPRKWEPTPKHDKDAASDVDTEIFAILCQATYL